MQTACFAKKYLQLQRNIMNIGYSFSQVHQFHGELFISKGHL